MSAKNAFALPLRLLNRVYDELLDVGGPEGDGVPEGLRETYPLLLDMLEMAIAEIDRRASDGSGDELPDGGFGL